MTDTYQHALEVPEGEPERRRLALVEVRRTGHVPLRDHHHPARYARRVGGAHAPEFVFVRFGPASDRHTAHSGFRVMGRK